MRYSHLYQAWGVPAAYRDVLPTSMPDDLRTWVAAAAMGRLWEQGNTLRGWGLVIVGDVEDTHRVLGTTISLLVRQSPMRKRFPSGIPRDFIRTASMNEIRHSLRENPALIREWAEYPILVVDIRNLDDKWSGNAVADVAVRRNTDGMPTVFVMPTGVFMHLTSPSSTSALSGVVTARSFTIDAGSAS